MDRDSRRWMDDGTTVFTTTVAALTDDELAAPSGLPNWTRRHVVAHVAANADALTRLAEWARTGVETRMYTSAEQRNGDIEAGAQLPREQLLDWLAESSTRLHESLDALTAEQSTSEVVTVQGRHVPASQLPWMRAREVLVHAVDLGAGVTFADLPPHFLAALAADFAAHRSAAGHGATRVMIADVDKSWEIAVQDRLRTCRARWQPWPRGSPGVQGRRRRPPTASPPRPCRRGCD